MQQRTETGLWVCHKFLRLIVLNNAAFRKHEYLVRRNNRIHPVGDCDHGRCLELSRDQLKDPLLCHNIDIGCGFIQDHDLVLAQDSSANTNKLLLTDRQVRASLFDLEGKPFAVGLLTSGQKRVEARLLKDRDQLVLWAHLEGVKVEPERALEQSWVLGDHRDFRAKLFQV